MEYLLTFGQNPPLTAEGKIEGGILSLGYAIGGLSFVLEISPRKVCHKTLGDGLSLEFIEGRRTEGTLRCGGSVAPYPIFCTRLSVEGKDGALRVRVVFIDGGEKRTTDILVTPSGAL